jgi:hypothetical protein
MNTYSEREEKRTKIPHVKSRDLFARGHVKWLGSYGKGWTTLFNFLFNFNFLKFFNFKIVKFFNFLILNILSVYP